MVYSAKILQNFQLRKCWKGITENSQNIARPCWGVIISVAIESVSQPSWIGASLEIIKKRIVSQRSLPVVHFFRRCFFHLWDFVKNKTSETPECAAFLRLNAGARMTHGGQVQRPGEKKLRVCCPPEFNYLLGNWVDVRLAKNFFITVPLCFAPIKGISQFRPCVS